MAVIIHIGFQTKVSNIPELSAADCYPPPISEPPCLSVFQTFTMLEHCRSGFPHMEARCCTINIRIVTQLTLDMSPKTRHLRLIVYLSQVIFLLPGTLQQKVHHFLQACLSDCSLSFYSEVHKTAALSSLPVNN